MSEAVKVYDGAINKGLEGVVASTTSISSIIDATLSFRGYTIEDLAANSTFEETSWLLWNNKLPTKTELDGFKAELKKEMNLPAALVEQLKKLPTKNIHPMAWLRSAVSMLGMYDDEAQDMSDAANRRKSLRLTAKMGLLVALFKRVREGKDFVAPNPEKSIAWNFLYMLEGKEPDMEFVKTFDTCLVLHADHEFNCSAFAARVTASSLSDIYSANVSAICALKGPLHGGANEQVMLMLKEIGGMDKIQGWVKDALANKVKVMGFGHRVYKNGDPRAKILSQMSETLTKKVGEPQYYEMSKILDDTMQKEKGLLPNVDFYSATVYYAMGIPIDIYTPIFAMSRVAGWCAHVLEQYSNNRIYRPRSQWTGPTDYLKYIPLDKR
jgi:citrate synthase